jgi:hypothetical protein
MIKKFEAHGEYYRKQSTYDWRKEFIEIRELFFNIEENIWDNGGSLDFQAGWRTGYGTIMYPCHLKDDEIVGDSDNIDHACGVYAKFCARVTIEPKFENSNQSPFKTTGSNSFFGENANIVLDIMNRVNYIKSKMKEYKIGITFDRDVIYINFLRDK